MPTYSAVDEAVVHASPSVVFAALLDECAGRSHWWAPHVRITPVGDPPFDHVGATARSAVRNGVTARFLWRLAAIEPDRLIRIEYAEGDLVGVANLTVEPVPEGTLLRYDWNVRPSSLRARILAPLLGMGKRHSDLMMRGVEGLERYLASK
jgi:hypothetical protein